MAQLSDDCFAFGGPLLSIDAAQALLRERLAPVGRLELVPLGEAVDRVLAADLIAGMDVPPHDNSAVDGFAVRHADLDHEADTVLPVMGRVAAGHAAPDVAGPVAVRIFTGAPMPPGFDTVMMQEDATLDGDRVTLRPGLKRGANSRKAGEDVKAGTVVIPAGRRLRPQDVGLAASVGATHLEVRAPLRVAVLSTGDEVVEPGTPLPPAGIYDSNRYTVTALLLRMGCQVTDMGILPDRLDTIRDALGKAAEEADLIVTTGGMSTGEEDHVKAAVEADGNLHFWRLAIKPGRPVALGQVRTLAGSVPLVGLPGNPVATMITFLHLVRPLIQRLSGWEVRPPPLFPVRAAFDYRKKKDRREYVRVTLRTAADGTLEAVKFPRDGAGILSSMAEADGLVELREDVTRVAPGDVVPYLPMELLLP